MRRDISFYRVKDAVSREFVRSSILGAERPALNEQPNLMLERSFTIDNNLTKNSTLAKLPQIEEIKSYPNKKYSNNSSAILAGGFEVS